MTTTTQTNIEVGNRCTVYRPDGSFLGTAMEIGTTWVRVMDWERDGTPLFNEWFPLSCEKVCVKLADVTKRV